MTPEQLASFDGKDGRPAYFAYEGKVYDASQSKFFRNGVHARIHKCGEDLTDALKAAPHDESVILERLPVVADLELPTDIAPPTTREKLQDLYHQYHPHPVMVHFPIALKIFGAALLLLFFMSRNPHHETASYYAILGGTLFSIPAIAAGILSWWLNYGMRWTRIFTVKFWGSMALLVLGMATVVMRMSIPTVAWQADAAGIIYASLYLLQVPIVIAVSYYGGKLSWPS